MKALEIVRNRSQSWRELHVLCRELERKRVTTLSAERLTRFASLYRSACADLALVDAYQLSPATVSFLHRLVGRAHNQLYRSRRLRVRQWAETLLFQVPRQIHDDYCVRCALYFFWGVFLLCALLASHSSRYPDFAHRFLPAETLDYLESTFTDLPWGRDSELNQLMAGFYIRHNTSIGLQCFAGGLLFLPGMLITIYNAALLGTMFGYMSRPDVAGGDNFFHFVTAHGPFELTAIVLSAGAGLKLGFGWVLTRGLTRIASLRKSATECMPILGAAMVLFFFAALIEAFLSPSNLPYSLKATTAIVCSGLITAYFVILGHPQLGRHATR